MPKYNAIFNLALILLTPLHTQTEKPLYLPGLNGIRAIAALAVVVSHTTLSLPDDFHLKGAFFGVNDTGGAKGYMLAAFGVTIFFALSGFLITYLLLLESDKQEIDVKKFYVRRILRIWPLYYCYLLLSVITLLLFGIAFEWKTILLMTFFAANIPAILNLATPLLYHFWSIGVEEQFYLFWPWIIKKIKHNLVLWLIVFIVLQNAARFFLWHYYPFSKAAELSLENRFDGMMIGAVGAILYKQKNALFLKWVDNRWMQYLVFFILALITLNKFGINASVVDNFVVSCITVALIVGQINRKNRWINLDKPVLDFLGKISYGIYVYHPLVIFFFSKMYHFPAGNPLYAYILVFASVITGTILIACISYQYFERRFIKWKRSLEVIKSSGTREA